MPPKGHRPMRLRCLTYVNSEDSIDGNDVESCNAAIKENISTLLRSYSIGARAEKVEGEVSSKGNTDMIEGPGSSESSTRRVRSRCLNRLASIFGMNSARNQIRGSKRSKTLADNDDTSVDDCNDVFGFKTRELLLCLRIPLLDASSSDVRSASLRSIRKLINSSQHTYEIQECQIHHLIARCLDLNLNNSSERIQALQLCRKILFLSPPNLFPVSIIKALVAIVDDNNNDNEDSNSNNDREGGINSRGTNKFSPHSSTSSGDTSNTSALSILCELCIIHTKQLIEGGNTENVLSSMSRCLFREGERSGSPECGSMARIVDCVINSFMFLYQYNIETHQQFNVSTHKVVYGVFQNILSHLISPNTCSRSSARVKINSKVNQMHEISVSLQCFKSLLHAPLVGWKVLFSNPKTNEKSLMECVLEALTFRTFDGDECSRLKQIHIILILFECLNIQPPPLSSGSGCKSHRWRLTNEFLAGEALHVHCYSNQRIRSLFSFAILDGLLRSNVIQILSQICLATSERGNDADDNEYEDDQSFGNVQPTFHAELALILLANIIKMGSHHKLIDLRYTLSSHGLDFNHAKFDKKSWESRQVCRFIDRFCRDKDNCHTAPHKAIERERSSLILHFQIRSFLARPRNNITPASAGSLESRWSWEKKKPVVVISVETIRYLLNIICQPLGINVNESTCHKTSIGEDNVRGVGKSSVQRIGSLFDLFKTDVPSSSLSSSTSVINALSELLLALYHTKEDWMESFANTNVFSSKRRSKVEKMLRKTKKETRKPPSVDCSFTVDDFLKIKSILTELVNFLKPSHAHFLSISFSEDNSSSTDSGERSLIFTILEVGRLFIHLIGSCPPLHNLVTDLLLDFESEMNLFLLGFRSGILRGSAFDKKTFSSGPSKVLSQSSDTEKHVFSRSNLMSTASRYYFLLLGFISHTSDHLMVKKNILATLVHFVETIGNTTSYDIYAKLLTSSLDFTRSQVARSLVNSILTTRPASVGGGELMLDISTVKAYVIKLLCFVLLKAECDEMKGWCFRTLLIQLFTLIRMSRRQGETEGRCVESCSVRETCLHILHAFLHAFQSNQRDFRLNHIDSVISEIVDEGSLSASEQSIPHVILDTSNQVELSYTLFMSTLLSVECGRKFLLRQSCSVFEDLVTFWSIRRPETSPFAEDLLLSSKPFSSSESFPVSNLMENVKMNSLSIHYVELIDSSMSEHLSSSMERGLRGEFERRSGNASTSICNCFSQSSTPLDWSFHSLLSNCSLASSDSSSLIYPLYSTFPLPHLLSNCYDFNDAHLFGLSDFVCILKELKKSKCLGTKNEMELFSSEIILVKASIWSVCHYASSNFATLSASSWSDCYGLKSCLRLISDIASSNEVRDYDSPLRWHAMLALNLLVNRSEGVRFLEEVGWLKEDSMSAEITSNVFVFNNTSDNKENSLSDATFSNNVDGKDIGQRNKENEEHSETVEIDETLDTLLETTALQSKTSVNAVVNKSPPPKTSIPSTEINLSAANCKSPSSYVQKRFNSVRKHLNVKSSTFRLRRGGVKVVASSGGEVPLVPMNNEFYNCLPQLDKGDATEKTQSSFNKKKTFVALPPNFFVTLSKTPICHSPTYPNVVESSLSKKPSKFKSNDHQAQQQSVVQLHFKSDCLKCDRSEQRVNHSNGGMVADNPLDDQTSFFIDDVGGAEVSDSNVLRTKLPSDNGYYTGDMAFSSIKLGEAEDGVLLEVRDTYSTRDGDISSTAETLSVDEEENNVSPLQLKFNMDKNRSVAKTGVDNKKRPTVPRRSNNVSYVSSLLYDNGPEFVVTPGSGEGGGSKSSNENDGLLVHSNTASPFNGGEMITVSIRPTASSTSRHHVLMNAIRSQKNNDSFKKNQQSFLAEHEWNDLTGETEESMRTKVPMKSDNDCKRHVVTLIRKYLSCQVTVSTARQTLYRLKLSCPAIFEDLCFYSSICNILSSSSYTFDKRQRNFMQHHLFSHLNFDALIKTQIDN